MSFEITILLSIYKKAPFLEEFLESLQRQTCQNFTLLCRFDDPEDNQYNKQLLKQYPFTQLLEDESHCGVVQSYNILAGNVMESPYIMFADQDDIWHSNKIERTLAEMKFAEREVPAGTPVLCHSDLRVVSQDLREIAPSFMKFQSLDSRCNKFREYLIQNNVTGCTVMINRPLLQLIDFQKNIICHDWYLALIASAFGIVRYIDTPLIDYRQHEENYYGAVPRKKLMAALFAKKKLNKRLLLTQKQAGVFLMQYGKKVSTENLKVLKAWSSLPEEKYYFKRLYTALKYRFRKNDLLRTLGMWWAL